MKTHGATVNKENANSIIKAFRKKFFLGDGEINWKGIKRPIWTQIKENLFVENLEGEIQEYIPKELAELFLYFEFENSLYRFSVEEIFEYFKTKPVWVELDTYIFTEEMSWCLVSTHDGDILLIRFS